MLRMLWGKRLLGVGCVCCVSLAGAAPTPWSQVSLPTRGAAQVIGGPSNGCVQGAQPLEASGPGFVSIRRQRQRYFSHPQTLAFVREMGLWAAERTGRLLMIGDLSQPRGGRMDSMHRSHQHGLDVDLWLTLAASPRQAWDSTPEARDPRTMVAADGRTLNSAWGAVQRDLLYQAARQPEVERMFVNPAIKQALCEQETDRRWLRKLRPWWGHDAHVHVRLRCPQDSPLCQAQNPLPPGSGCDASLAWWFREEARAPRKSTGKKDSPPAPPPACQAVLQAAAFTTAED